MIYKRLIRSNLDWSCIFYDSGCEFSLNKVDVVQFAALRVILGLMRTTPTNIILDLANEPPLTCRRDYLKRRFMVKLFSCDIPIYRNAFEPGL